MRHAGLAFKVFGHALIRGRDIQEPSLRLVVLKRRSVHGYADAVHTVYSLRHTAICMRLVLSHGKVNIYNLAKNAGTSVDQIERFYAKNLPLSAELARNLQSFGE